jgi:hypothetical protein
VSRVLKPCGTSGAYARGCRCVVCKEAHRARTSNWRTDNPDKARQSSQRWYDNNKESSIAKARASNVAKYNMTLAEYDSVVKSNTVCQACGDVLVTGHLDHDHSTGIVRGVLCIRCNTVAGLCGDTMEGVNFRMRKIVDYLQRFESILAKCTHQSTGIGRRCGECFPSLVVVNSETFTV